MSRYTIALRILRRTKRASFLKMLPFLYFLLLGPAYFSIECTFSNTVRVLAYRALLFYDEDGILYMLFHLLFSPRYGHTARHTRRRAIRRIVDAAAIL